MNRVLSHETRHQIYIGPARVNRDGWYLHGYECWFEINGNVFTIEDLKEDFEFQLKVLNINMLTQEQVDDI